MEFRSQLSSLTWPVAARVQALVFVPNRVRIAIVRWHGATIAPGVLMRHRVAIRDPRHLTIGADSWIGEKVALDNRGPIAVGANVVLSQAAQLIARRGTDIAIADGAWIALRATVVGPCVVGAGAVVGATAVARDAVAPGQVQTVAHPIIVDSHPHTS